MVTCVIVMQSHRKSVSTPMPNIVNLNLFWCGGMHLSCKLLAITRHPGFLFSIPSGKRIVSNPDAEAVSWHLIVHVNAYTSQSIPNGEVYMHTM